MRVVDTSAWIEFLVASQTGSAVRRHLPTASEWIVPTIVQLELAKWARRNADQARMRRILALSGTYIVMGLSSEIAEHAAECCVRYGLSTADAVIYATARLMGADLLTCDAHFEELPHVIHVPKLSS